MRDGKRRVWEGVAQHDYPDTGIKKGDHYYWWQMAGKPKGHSLTYPRKSQITSSDFNRPIFVVEEIITYMDGWEKLSALSVDQRKEYVESTVSKACMEAVALANKIVADAIVEKKGAMWDTRATKRAAFLRQWAEQLRIVLGRFEGDYSKPLKVTTLIEDLADCEIGIQ